ncbi:flagellar hook-basal body complex protein FliE [Sphingomonas floccifaciens]|uniref:Flagellar hook-basal body complex protein FliE n=1 Tax=Sphingomonas floccifaciens TaxID=1844115 RepID=A0ABW4NEY9_9SPHN
MGSLTDVRNVLAARDAILQRNAALRGLAQPARAPEINPAGGVRPSFATAFDTALRATPTKVEPPVSPAGSTGVAASEGISSTLTSLLARVNATQEQEDAMTESYERGETTDIVGVVLAQQRASVDFEATLQVRNKLLSAYKDIMNMQL